MDSKLQKYQIAIGIIGKGLKRIGFSEEDMLDIIRYIDDKYKNIK